MAWDRLAVGAGAISRMGAVPVFADVKRARLMWTLIARLRSCESAPLVVEPTLGTDLDGEQSVLAASKSVSNSFRCPTHPASVGYGQPCPRHRHNPMLIAQFWTVVSPDINSRKAPMRSRSPSPFPCVLPRRLRLRQRESLGSWLRSLSNQG